MAATTTSRLCRRADSNTIRGNLPFPAMSPYVSLIFTSQLRIQFQNPQSAINSADEPTRSCFDKPEEHLHFRGGPLLLSGVLQRIARVELRPEKYPIDLFQLFDGGLGYSFSLQADCVDSESLGLVAIADRLDVGQGVAGDDREPADKGMGTDAAELVHGGKCADGRMVLDEHMAGESRSVGHNDVITDARVVGHVAVSHKEVAVPDRRQPSAAFCSTIYRDEFPEDIPSTDMETRDFPLVLEILGIGSDGPEAVKPTRLSDRGPALDLNMGLQSASLANPNLRSNNTIRSDLDIRPDLRSAIDDSRGMNFHSLSRVGATAPRSRGDLFCSSSSLLLC